MNIASDKLLAHLGRVCGDHRPITADVFITNYCNNKCPYCTYKRWDLGSSANAMSFADFQKYTRRLLQLGVLGIILTGGGEPTINPEFSDITAWLEDHHIRYGINTNFNILKLFKPEFLKISLDGHDRESYLRNRGVDAYEDVIAHIKEYAAWRRLNAPHTALGIQCIPRCKEDVAAFWMAHRDLDVDYMVFRPVESTGGRYYMDHPDWIDAIITEIDTISKKDVRCVRNFKWGMLGMQETECTAQWAQIAVNENGDVIYCCQKPYQIIGNLMDKDILERKAMAKTDMSQCDIPCRMTSPNAIMKRIQTQMINDAFI